MNVGEIATEPLDHEPAAAQRFLLKTLPPW